jgi:hypothetical protein
VDKAHRLYRTHGLCARDDALAMQSLIPGWKFNPQDAVHGSLSAWSVPALARNLRLIVRRSAFGPCKVFGR